MVSNFENVDSRNDRLVCLMLTCGQVFSSESKAALCWKDLGPRAPDLHLNHGHVALGK